MANIKVCNIKPTGSELFCDSESYLTDLSEEELVIHGGITPVLYAAAASSEPCGLFIAVTIGVITEPDWNWPSI